MTINTSFHKICQPSVFQTAARQVGRKHPCKKLLKSYTRSSISFSPKLLSKSMFDPSIRAQPLQAFMMTANFRQFMYQIQQLLYSISHSSFLQHQLNFRIHWVQHMYCIHYICITMCHHKISKSLQECRKGLPVRYKVFSGRR